MAPPCRAPPLGSRGQGPGRRWGSSPRQVPQGHTRPGGFKPQVKVERGWSFSSNPFYTVKTAKLSPRRPLLIGRQTDDKPKQTCELTFFRDVFPSQQKARSLKGNRSVLTFARFGAWAGARRRRRRPSAWDSLTMPLSPSRSPGFSNPVPPLHGSCGGHTLHPSPIRRFLAGAEGQLWALGCWGAPSAFNWPQIQVPPKPGREE